MGWEIFSPPVASRPAMRSTLCAILLMQVAISPGVKQSWHDNRYPTVGTVEINKWSSFSASLHVVIRLVAKLRARTVTPRSFTCKIYRPFDVSVTAHHWYNSINSQLDATIIILLIISISSTCFGRYFRPSSGALDSVYNSVPPHPVHQQAASSVFETTSCKHCLVLLRIGKSIARSMLS